MIQRGLVKQIQAERRALSLERRRQREEQACMARQKLREIEEREKMMSGATSSPP